MSTDPVAKIDHENVGAARTEIIIAITAAEVEIGIIDLDETIHANVIAGVQMMLTSLDGRSVVIVVGAGGLDLELTTYVLQLKCIWGTEC